MKSGHETSLQFRRSLFSPTGKTSSTRSCSLPLNRGYYDHFIYEESSFDKKIESYLSREKATKFIHFLLAIGILCLLFLFYVVFDQDTTKPISREECIQKFRSNNCSNEQSSIVCKDLYACISNPPSSVTSSMTKNANIKIDTIQELLENFLLILGGMGFTGILASLIMHSQLLIHRLKRFGKVMLLSILRIKKHRKMTEKNQKSQQLERQMMQQSDQQ